MFTLFKRELKSLILKPFTLAAFVLLFLVPAIVFSVFVSFGVSNAEESGQLVYAGFENLVSVTGLLLAIVIPAVVIYSVYSDRKNKSVEYLITLPVSKTAISFSKFLSLLAFFIAPLIVFLAYPLMFAGYGEVNYLQAYLALLMLVVFTCFLVAFSFMIATRISRVIVAYIVSYILLIVSYIVGILAALVRFLPFGTGFDTIAEGILTELSIFKKLDKLLFELFDWTTLLFFLIGTIIFVVIAFMPRNKKSKNKISAKKVCVLCVSFALVICVGIVPTFLPYSIRQIDISNNDLYTLEDEATDFLSELDEDVTIYLINPYSNDKALYNSIVRTAEKSDHITIEVVNTLEDTEFLGQYIELSTQNNEILTSTFSYAMIIKSDKRWRMVTQADCYGCIIENICFSKSDIDVLYENYYNIAFELYKKDNLTSAETTKFQTCIQMLEYLDSLVYDQLLVESVMVESIEYVVADVIPKAYFLAGHGEEGRVSIYDLSEKSQLPKDADVVVINSPSEDYSEEDIELFKKYVDNGGKLVIFADGENANMPNFSALLKYFGLKMDSSLISEGAEVDISANKNHSAFSDSSTFALKMQGVSKISTEGEKYTYDTMLSYSETVGEGDEAVTNSYPVAVSVSKDGEKCLALITGAKTFNGENEDYVSLLNDLVSWMFEPFSAEHANIASKTFQKAPCLATTADVIKSVIVFVVIIPSAVLFSALIYGISRNLRSKKGKNENPEIY